MAKKNEFKTHFTADTSSFNKGLSTVKKGIAGIAGIATGVLAPLVAIGGAIGGIGLAIQSINAAADVEVMTLQFESLLGSVDAAHKRMDELRKFATTTPFQLEGIAKANATLEGMTQGALSTTEGMRLVGDVAATSGTDLAEMAQILGKLYQKLNAGKKAGEVFDQLAERKGILAGLRSELERMQDNGASGAEVWEKAKDGLLKYEGSMLKLSKTFRGLMSTLGDAWENLKVIFGTPLMESLKPILDDAIARVDSFKEKAKSVGEAVGTAIRAVYNAYTNGELWSLIQDGASLIGDYLYNNIIKIGKVLADMLPSVLLALGASMTGFAKALWDKETLKAFGHSMSAIAIKFVKTLREGMPFQTKMMQIRNALDETAIQGHNKEAEKSWKKVNKSMNDALVRSVSHGMLVDDDLKKSLAKHSGADYVGLKDKKAALMDKVDKLSKQGLKAEEDKAEKVTSKVAKSINQLSGLLGGIAGIATITSRPEVTDLTRIGGDRGTSTQSLVNLQERANQLLTQIVTNTKHVNKLA